MKNENEKHTSGSSPSEASDCRVCGEPIKAGATKCIHCSSFQDWTRHLLKWSAVVVSILGIVPLWSIAWSLYNIAFYPKTADVEAAVTNCSEKEIKVAFANSGKLDGIVTDVKFVLMQNGKRQETDVEARAVDTMTNIVVSPGKPPVLVSYRAYIGDTETRFISRSRSSDACSFVLEINWVDFRGSEKQISRGCSCP